MTRQRKKVRRSLWKKIFRWFIYLFSSFFLILFLFAAYLYWQYRPEKLKQMAIEKAASDFSLNLQIGDVYIHPFYGFQLEDIQMTPLPDDSGKRELFPLKKVHVKKVMMGYSLREILNKKLIIHEVTLDMPELEVFIDMTDTTAIDFAALLRLDLPISLNLKKFRFKNADLKIDLGYSEFVQNIFIENLEFHLDNWRMPRGILAEKDSLFQGDCRILCEHSRFVIDHVDTLDQNIFHFSSILDFDFHVNARTFAHVTSGLHLALDEISWITKDEQVRRDVDLPYPVRLQLGTLINGREAFIRVDSLVVSVDHKTWLQTRIQLDSLNRQPQLSFRIEKGKIPINQLVEFSDIFMGESFASGITSIDKSSFINFSGTSVSGRLPVSDNKGDLYFQAIMNMTPADVHMNNGMFIKGIHLSASASGTSDASIIHGLKNSVMIAYDSLYYTISDSFDFYAGPGQFTVEGLFNGDFVPQNAACSLHLTNLLGTEIIGNLQLSSASSLQDLKGKGLLQWSNFALNQLPELAVDGELGSRLSISINSLADVDANLSIFTGPLVMQWEDELAMLNELNISLGMSARTDTSFKHISIDSCSLAVNDMISGTAHGKIDLAGREKSEFILHDISIDHRSILNFFPEIMKTGFVELDVTGATHIAFNAEAKFPEMKEYDVDARLYTERTSIYHPEQFLTVNGLNVDTRLNLASGSDPMLQFDVLVDSVLAGRIRSRAFSDNHLKVKVISRNFDALSIPDCELRVPDLGLLGHVKATISQLGGNPEIDLIAEIKQEAHDTLSIMSDFAVSGVSDVLIKLEMDSTLADFQADIRTEKLTIHMPPSLSIKDMDTRIKIEQQFDTVSGRIMGDSAFKIITPSNAFIDYLVYWDYYSERLRDLSHLKIKKVQVAGYEIDDVKMDLMMRNGRIEVPAIYALLYDGNVGGRFTLDLSNGTLEEASYDLNAHFANIDSDLLLPETRLKNVKGIIDGSLELRGTGLNPEKQMNIDGHLYLTKIGPRVADNMLRSLDPQGTDSGIRSTRILLNRGFKPKLMTFEIRHGYLNPTIIFSQPWYFPMRLSGGRVELSRVPVEFFIQNALHSQFSSE